MSNETRIITHRGLEPSKKDFYPESSYESFKDQLKRGFGVEFDINFVKDGIIIFHDSNLSRITKNKDNRYFQEMKLSEIKKIKYGKKEGHIPSFEEMVELIRERNSYTNAIHLKGKYQSEAYLDILILKLMENKNIHKKLIIFDVLPKTAEILKLNFPNLRLAPSVAHSYDIKRYNSAVTETLISIEEVLKYKEKRLYDWVWLDEWDLADERGKKKFYTPETFKRLRQEGYKIALVTPELHGTSPGLLGGEAHEDAINKKKLFERIEEILNLKPDAVCTDYPEEVKKLLYKPTSLNK